MQKSFRQARILATGTYLPEKILTNEDLEKIVDTTSEWIVTRTGMKERRIASQDEFPSDMGVKAARIALHRAEVSPSDLDLVLVATMTPDYAFPSTACIIQAKLEAHNAAAVDIQAACTGFIYALSMAKAYIESGIYKNILIIATEKLSTIVDYTDRNTCILFGDGACAAVVSSVGKGLLIQEVCLGSDGAHANLLAQSAGGARMPASIESVQSKLHYLRMDGKEIFKLAVTKMESAAREVLKKTGLEEHEIAWLIPHQANIRIIETLAKRFQIPMEKVYTTLHKYGNTSASSIGIALDELIQLKSIKPKEHLLLSAFGAGLTWGATVLTYE